MTTIKNETLLAERSQRFYAFVIDSLFSFSISFLIPIIFSIFSFNSNFLLNKIYISMANT